MGEAPERIRAEIEQTRAEMGETVDAIGYKADVPARAKESIQHKADAAKEGIVGAATGVRDKLVGARDTVGEAAPDREQVARTGRQAVGMAKENPLGLAIGAVAVGFIAGLLIPSTRVEDEKIGPMADDVRQRAMETGQEALEHGKQVAQEAVQSAQETVKESAPQHAEQVKETAQQHAEDVRQQAPTGA